MMSFAASSTDMSSRITSRRGTKSRKPEVGFGVVGRKTLTRSGSPALRRDLAEGVGGDEGDAPEALARVLDEAGLLERVAGLVNSVSAICFRPL